MYVVVVAIDMSTFQSYGQWTALNPPQSRHWIRTMVLFALIFLKTENIYFNQVQHY